MFTGDWYRTEKAFDTELAGRIAGFPRVGLGALAESLLNIRLAKEHSAVDWSKRPLHHDWLIYAALDVDVLLDLKDEIVRVLKERSKLSGRLKNLKLHFTPNLHLLVKNHGEEHLGCIK